jgi:hypothetical protein
MGRRAGLEPATQGSSLTLPDDPGQSGEMRLIEAGPRSGSSWTNSGEIREKVPPKHRAEGDARHVPVHPDLVTILKAHLTSSAPRTATVGSFAGRTTDQSPTAPTSECSTEPVLLRLLRRKEHLP